MMPKRDLILVIETEHFSYFNGKLTIVVDDNSEIKLQPNGIYMGYNWFADIILGKVKDIVKSAVDKIVEKNEKLSI